jgi:hypothetical protein
MKEKSMKLKLYRGLALVAGLALALFVQGDALAALSGRVSSTAAMVLTSTPDAGTATWDYGAAGTFTINLTDGATANKASKIHVDTIATGTSFDLDAGTLTTPLGVAQAAFARIVMIRVCAPSTNTAVVAVGGDFILSKYFTGWVDDALTIPVHPGGCFMFTAPDATGVAVTATSGDVLTVTPSGVETAYVAVIGS